MKGFDLYFGGTKNIFPYPPSFKEFMSKAH
ncbi:MAG: hypothetical protein RIR31_1822 [Bacteroidota bacterium]|jgi:hypothetical protein